MVLFNCGSPQNGYSYHLFQSHIIHSITVHFTGIFLLLGMQRSVVEYLVNQTIIVIMYIDVM